MKFLHIGDLHIGKRVNEFPMIENQKEILQRILNIAKNENADGIIIAGDIYDNSLPSIEAIEVFEELIEQLVQHNIPAYIVSGNHDSVERLSAFSNLIKKNNIFIAKTFNGKLEAIHVEDTDIWLLPFIRPADVRRFYPNIEIGSYQDAVRTVIENCELTASKNILVAHQFVTAGNKNPETSDSETSSLGTLDSVDYSIFTAFDYVALGHIHKPQSMGRKEVRYCGSPLKYSFSEVNQNKSVTIIDINKKVTFKTIDLIPIRDMKELKGSLEEILMMEKCEDYMHITLTDNSAIDAKSKLETIFPNIMKLDFEEYNCSSNAGQNLKTLKEKSITEHFSEFFEKQTTQKLQKEEHEIIFELLESINFGGSK